MAADRVGQGRQDHGRVPDRVLMASELQRQGRTGYFLSERGSEKEEVNTYNGESLNITLCLMFLLPPTPRRSRLARTLSDPVHRPLNEGRHLHKHTDRVEASDPVRTLSSPRHLRWRPSPCASAPEGAPVNNLAPDQHAALDRAVAWYATRHRLYFRLEGAAGTGKTSTVRQIADRLAPGSTAYIAPTGKAAAVLRSKGCDDATTVHAAIYKPAGERTAQIRALQAELDALPPWQTTQREKLEAAIAKVRAQPIWTLRDTDKAFGGKRPNLIVLDEASMVDDRMFADLLALDVPVLALGDPYQLPPVAGQAKWQTGKPDALLTTVHRFGANGPLIDLATTLRRGHQAPAWNGTAGMARRYWTPADLGGYDQVIVGRNATRWQIVEALRDAAGREPGCPEPGDRIMVLRNDPDHDVVNGQQATVVDALPVDGDWALTVQTDVGVTAWHVDGRGFGGQAGQDEAKRDRDSELVAATFAQAITCHSAQGSQWPRVAVVDEASVFRQAATSWRYTAATRAEQTCLLLDPRRMIRAARQMAAAA